jgi:chemotaxis protein methyltransferase CheR
MKHRSPPTSSDEASPVDSGLGAAEFEALRALIYELTGISLNDSKRSLVEARLARRLRSLGMASYAEYCDFVRSDEVDDDEVRELINCTTSSSCARRCFPSWNNARRAALPSG